MQLLAKQEGVVSTICLKVCFYAGLSDFNVLKFYTRTVRCAKSKRIFIEKRWEIFFACYCGMKQ